MSVDIGYYRRIERWAPELKGVFTLPDIRVLFKELGEAALFKNLRDAVRENILIKAVRGVYAVPGAPLEAISSRIEPGSYISTGTVLARHALIGSIPARKVQAIKIGRPRTYRLPAGVIEHLSIHPKLYFGFEAVDGINYASPEKAFIDACYYRYKGRKFSFDPASDVNRELLDAGRLKEYLSRYDRRFLDFFDRIRGK